MNLLRCLFFSFLSLIPAAVVPALVCAQQLNINVLHAFSGAPDGAFPNANLIEDSQGNLFGTTGDGGDPNCLFTLGGGCGIVFEYAADGTYTVLYAFQGLSDGHSPTSGVAIDNAGNLYGTTRGDFSAPSTLYEIPKTGGEITLKEFTNFVDGASVMTAPIVDSNGHLFGNSTYGGDANCGFNGNGCGVVYQVDGSGNFHLLHTFTSLPTGIQPVGSPVLDSQGNLFGITEWGGNMKCETTVGCGTVFEITNKRKFKILHKFSGTADGSYPACITDDGAGNIVGVTSAGGDLQCEFFGCGTIFRLFVTTGKLETLYAFTPFTINNSGHSCLTHDGSGNLYGSTSLGGTANAGYLYKLSSSGAFSVLFNFPGASSPQGGVPLSQVLDPSGTFYGVAGLGGDVNGCGLSGEGCGTIFSLTH